MTDASGSQPSLSDAWGQRFTLGDWDARASVRTSKNSYLLPSDLEHQLQTRHWFPPAFLPYLSHPTIKQAGPSIVHRLTANHLVYFLDYTTLLEHRIVNRSVETIVHDELGVNIPQRMKTAALQLYTDEGYHALFSNTLAEQIASLYGIAQRPVMPQRISRLNNLLGQTPDRHKALAWFLVGFVSETIIARELLDICRDTLVSGVQEMLRDHLADEARHSRYFSEVFHYLWLTLNSSQRTFAARLLLDILLIFFEVDERWLKDSLRSVALEETCIANILADLTGLQALTQRARSGAGATLHALNQAGFFDLPYNQQLFTQAGLVDG
ncbi:MULTISPECIES: diiron oxygenase [unclassified Pseudomonas]|uniref:diiron oxygenase n=1 Tax=unclassified Pseudomonas TaxID=196821 RepID=UPI002AC9C5E5|nr:MULTISPECIES: diiron oxygenase [unclassified Pseudomonas]MEB0044006.1 diiron oxygenase [Pseudomonas sp. Dout3]MEB0095056.1 diiron oxygenase [Pseudomonas sp. DC1.2]WPX58620.1 diiron oxygenase [Pseudomonas sp. DC1.2]